MTRRATTKSDKGKSQRRNAKGRQTSRPHPSSVDLQKQLRAQARELQSTRRQLAEAVEQQTATSEVLSVISRSPGDLTPVFQAMLEKAVRISESGFGVLFRMENGHVQPCALHNLSEPLQRFVLERGKV